MQRLNLAVWVFSYNVDKSMILSDMLYQTRLTIQKKTMKYLQ